MARAMWKGVIRLGSTRLPVKLYSAVQDHTVHFRLLHEKDREPVKQQLVHPETGDPVPFEDVQWGHEVERGVFVILSDEELAKLEPAATRDIEVLRFVKPDALEDPWYDRPYFLGPDADTEAYFALVEALRAADRVGIAHWAMRKREYIGALRLRGDHLMLVTLRHAGEVISASSLPAPGGRAPSKQEIDMAEQLISALEGAFDPAEFRDEYRDRVMELIESKAKGRKVRLQRAPRKRAEADLTQALKRSIANATKKRAA
jgi:DNA end-binding protein Ku